MASSTTHPLWTRQDTCYALQALFLSHDASRHQPLHQPIHVAKLSAKLNLLVFTCHFQFHINNGKTLVGILCLDYLGLKMARTPYLLLWTDSLKWLILYHAIRQTMLHMLPISFVGKSCDCTVYQRQLCRIETSSSSATFGRRYAPSSESSYSSPWRTTLKPMAKQKSPTRHLQLSYACC